MTSRLLLSKRAILSASSAALISALIARPAFAQAGPRPAAARRLTDAGFITGLHAHLDELARDDSFSGAVLIAKDGKVLFERAYGYADHAFAAPNRADTKFNLGSMGKMFTGVAVLQLVQQGRLSLDDKLSKVLPDYPDKDIADRITIYQILTHTSGLGDMFNQKYMDTPKEKFSTLAAHLPLFTGKPLLFEPGAKWSYSNAGFIVLGLVVEKVSGQSYYDYVREHVFRPAGMADTDNYEPHDDVPNLAIGYTSAGGPGGPGGGGPRRALNFPGGLPPKPRIKNSDFVQKGAAAGGGYSTVADLFRFAQALQGGRLLDKAHTELDMTGKVATTHGTAKYGFGMEEDFINGVRIVGHGGGGPGINSNLDMYPELGYTVAVMTNLDGAVSLANERIRLWLTGQELPQAVRLPPQALQGFAGKYVVDPGAQGAPPGVSMEVSADRDGLWLTSGPRHRLAPLSPLEFFDDNFPNARFLFARDAQGRIARFQMSGMGAGRPPLTMIRQD